MIPAERLGGRARPRRAAGLAVGSTGCPTETVIRLRVERDGQLRPPALRPESAGVATWRDAGGEVYAYAELRGVDRRIDVPGVARYRFTTSSPEVVAWPAAGVREELLLDHYYRGILPLALQARGLEVVHASAVEHRGSILALAAPKESGKSTLAFGLGRRGLVPWADDAVAFDVGERGIDAIAQPFDLRLRAAPAALFGESRRVPVSRRAGAAGEPFEIERKRLAAIVVLDRLPSSRDAPVCAVDRLHGAVALLAVLAHAYCFEREDADRLRRMTDRYLTLVAHVPVYSLRYRSGLEHLTVLLNRLEEILAEHAAVPA